MSEPTDATVMIPAPKSRRLLALAIDLGILLLVSMPIINALINGNTDNIVIYAMNSAPAWLGIIGFNLFILDSSGQTVGKRLMKLKIVTTDGHKPHFSRLLFIRHLPFLLLALIPYIGPLALLAVVVSTLRKDGQSFADRLAGTRVICT